MTKELEAVLNFDSLYEAEQQTGVSYKESDATTWIGMGLMIENNKKKKHLLQQRDDTHYGTTCADYIRIANDIGFQLVTKVDFEYNGNQDSQQWFWHDAGVLLVFDTYNNHAVVNTAKIHYSHKANVYPAGDIYSSGSYNQSQVWTGDTDVREALRYTMSKLIENGEFVTPWEGHPFVYGKHYAEDKQKETGSYEEKTARRHILIKERLSSRPDILEAIGACL